jgi:DNA-binding CsgD family transcriptional regulator
MPARVEDLLADGTAAVRHGDAAAARQAYAAAAAIDPSGAALEGLATAAYLARAYDEAIATWERAYARYRDEDEHVGAVRVARKLAFMYGSVIGDGAVMQGWLGRARRLLTGTPDSLEGGWVAQTLGMFEPDPVLRERHLRAALDVARRFRDGDLEFSTLARLGTSLVRVDRTEEGMALLDEALAAVAGDEVEDFEALHDIFCQLFVACERAHDVSRAEQWIRVGETVAQRRGLPVVAAFCNTHYGAIMTAAGRWQEADVALTDAVRLWGLGHRVLRADALVRLADLRVRQGRLEEAEQLLEGLDYHRGAARPRAAILLARDQAGVACDVLEHAIADVGPESSEALPLLLLLVDGRLALGDAAAAQDATQRLIAGAQRHPSDYHLASAALARARMCLVMGGGEAGACLREALSGFARAGLPMELAHTRLQLATALVDDRPEVAMREARAALDAFGRLRAARDADAAAALLRSLGVRAGGPSGRSADVLTKREAEVLELLGAGLTNREIADRLFISPKTAEHHVARVLAKLGLRGRAEAAAYAVRATSGAK